MIETATKKNKGTTERTRNWTLLVYPKVDSDDKETTNKDDKEGRTAPKNWRSVLDDLHVQWIEGPLHDKDTKDDGTLVKPHKHILIMFDGVKSYKQVERIAKKLHTQAPERCESARGLVRYMIHLDNPEKYQYPKSEIVGHGGADVETFFEMSATSRLDKLKDIASFILEKHVTSFSDLVRYAIENDDDWFTILADKNTLFVNKLIDSEWKKANKSLYQKQ